MSEEKQTDLSPRSVAANLADEIRNVASKAKNEKEVDRRAAEIWGLTEVELKDIQASLRAFGQ